MKCLSLALSVLFLSLLLGAPLSRAHADDDLYLAYQEGREAFVAGNYELAREKLAIVLAKNPSHPQTRAMMAQIIQKIGQDNTFLRKSYEKIILPKVEFTDVELGEAITAVRLLTKKATNDKLVPNIIIKGPDLAKKPVTLNLNQVPLSEVLNYLGQLAGAKVNYEQAAVILSSPAG